MFIGKDGFIWWIGVVESNLDPEVLGRCKVRIFGYHPAHSEAKVSNDELPWAITIHPANTPNLFAVPQPGEWVFGFFLDGQDAKEPAILGYIPANPDSDRPTFASKGSPAQAVKNKINIIRNFHRASTTSDAANSVIWEHGNHIIEMAKNGSIYIEHKSGSYINMTFNGDVAVYSANNLYLSANNNVNIVAQNGSITATANTDIVTSTQNGNIGILAKVPTGANYMSSFSSYEKGSIFVIGNASMVLRTHTSLEPAGRIDIISKEILMNSQILGSTSNTASFASRNMTINTAQNLSITALSNLSLSGGNTSLVTTGTLSVGANIGNFNINTLTVNAQSGFTVTSGGAITLDGSTVNLG